MRSGRWHRQAHERGAGKRRNLVLRAAGEARNVVMSTGRPYVELHAHSAFSFLDGASTPTELAAAAAALGYPAIALTDHDGVWGSMEFAHACHGLGVRPITGAELTRFPRR